MASKDYAQKRVSEAHSNKAKIKVAQKGGRNPDAVSGYKAASRVAKVVDRQGDLKKALDKRKKK